MLVGLILCGLLDSPRVQEVEPLHRLFLAEDRAGTAWTETVELVAGVAAEDGVRLERPELVGPGLDANSDFGRLLFLGRLAHRRGASEAWRLEFQGATGVLRLFLVDERRGLHHLGGCKVRSVGGEALDEEHRAKILARSRELARQMRELQQAFDQDRPRPEFGVPVVDEGRPRLGFEWEYGEGPPRVGHVWPTSLAHQSGLRAGDQILRIDGADVSSPALFGRRLIELAAGREFELELRRDGEARKLQARAVAPEEFDPAVEASLIGSELAELLPEDPPAAGNPGDAPALLVLVDSRRPDSLLPLLACDWLARHRTAALRIQVIDRSPDGRGATSGDLALPFPLRVDDGTLARVLRAPRLPSLVLADAEGVVQARPRTGEDLLRLLRSTR